MSSSLASQPTHSSLGVTVAPGVWMRRRPWTVGYASLTLAMAACWAWLWIYFPILGHNERQVSTGNRVFEGVMFIALAALTAIVAVRIWRAALLIGPDGIVLRGVFRTRSFPLNTVDGFAPIAGNGFPCPWLNRPHRRPLLVAALSLGGIAKTTPRRAQQLQPLCDDLNTLLKSLQLMYPSEVAAAGPAEAKEEAARASRRVRAGLVATAGAYWIAAGFIIASNPTVARGVGFGALGILYTSFVCLAAWLVKRNATTAKVPPTDHGQPDTEQ